MYQEYILKNQESFELEHIFECGQCFRWNREENDSYTGVFKNNVLNVYKIKNDIVFKGIVKDDIKEIVENYFDLKRNYTKIKEKLSKVDDNIKKSIEYGAGIRILNQDLVETIISFIISANNNIPRIKRTVEKLCRNYGDEIIWEKKKYYCFPRLEQLKNVTVEEYKKLGLGFRDIRIYNTVQILLNNEIDYNTWYKENNTYKIREQLLNLAGVGPKVADCILLFSDLKRFDVFPVDVWVRRVMNELYIKNEDETKVSKNKIQEIAEEKFGEYQGIAQQYLFYHRRN